MLAPDGAGLGRETPTAVGQAYDALLEFVKSAPVGTRLPSERELAVRLGVSRTTVRSAADRLALTGFLDVRRGAGAVTRRPGPQHLAAPFADALAGHPSLQEAYAVRLILEPQLAARVAKRTSPALSASLRSAVEGQDGDFHARLAGLAGNTVAAQVVGVLIGLTASTVGAPEPGSSTAMTRALQHTAVVEAVADGDADLARQAMRLNLRWEARLVSPTRLG